MDALSRSMFAPGASRVVRVAAVVGALAVVLVLGVLGIGHDPADAHMDARFFYLAGKYWLAGLSAYTPAVVLADVDPDVVSAITRQCNFAYPPQTAPLCLLLGSGSMAQAYLLMDLVNLAAIAVLAWIAVWTIEEAGVPPAPASTAHRWFVPGLIAGNLSTAFVVWTGQTTLLAAAGLAAAWYYARRDRWVIAGIGLAIATFKPPLSIFVVLWFVLTRQWRVLFAAAVTVLVFSAVPMIIVGPVKVFFDWLHAVARYGDYPQNAFGSRMLFNLRSLLHAVGIGTPDLSAVGLLATLALWWYRRSFAERDLLALLIGAALLFGSSHSYDLAALVVLVPAFWRYLHPRAWAALAALALLLAISFPNSMLERFHVDLLLHARVALVVGALLWLMALSADASRGRAPG
jgi:hypothetical protein